MQIMNEGFRFNGMRGIREIVERRRQNIFFSCDLRFLIILARLSAYIPNKNKVQSTRLVKRASLYPFNLSLSVVRYEPTTKKEAHYICSQFCKEIRRHL